VIERQGHVDREHEDQRAEQRHCRDEGVLGPVMGDLADLLEVLGEPPDQVAGLLVVEVAERQPLQVVEGGAPHVGLDVDAEHVAPVGDGGDEPGIDDVDAQQPDSGEQDDRPVLAREEPVDEDRHGDREPQLQQARQHRTREVQREQPAVGAVVGEEAGAARRTIVLDRVVGGGFSRR
jgi:hypothetical protein